MEERLDKDFCVRCKRVILDISDALDYKGRMYCPECYVKVVKSGEGPSRGQSMAWILWILIIILGIISLLISIASY